MLSKPELGLAWLALFMIPASACVCGRSRTVKARAELSGDEVLPPVATASQGEVWVTFGQDEDRGGSLGFRVYVDSLSSPVTGIHIHEGEPGTVGRVVFSVPLVGINPEGPPFEMSPSFRWPEDEIPAREMFELMRSGGLYIDLHTEAHPDGELRGTLVPESVYGWHDYHCT